MAWHYGDPVCEQHALAAGRAVVDLSHRGVLRVTGADRLSWLHSLTTQDLAELPPHRPAETLLLSPRGHVEYALHLVDDGDASWITVEPGRAGSLAAWLESMRFLLRVQVEDVTVGWAVLGRVGWPPSQTGGPPVWDDPWPRPDPWPDRSADRDTTHGTGRREGAGRDHPGYARPWREWLVERRDLLDTVSRAPALAGAWAEQALRVAALRPRDGAETDHRTVPHELDWLRSAVHLDKGCYRGQETVAKIHNLGRPPRRLTLLHLDGSEHGLPEPGDAVDLDGRRVGRVTTPVRHAELGPIALAVLSMRTPLDADLLVHPQGQNPIAAAQEPIVRP